MKRLAGITIAAALLARSRRRRPAPPPPNPEPHWARSGDSYRHVPNSPEPGLDLREVARQPAEVR